MDGRPVHHERIFRHIDVIFNALHGEYGEDGKVQQLLEAFGVPYTGSGVMASALGMNKILARQAFKSAGLKVPSGFEIVLENGLAETAKKFSRQCPRRG